MLVEAIAYGSEAPFEVLCFLTAAVALLTWRLWAFQIDPWLHPKKVEHLPYWIPVFGHTGSMFKNTCALYARANAYFGFSQKPYALQIGGRACVVISDPGQQTQVFKDYRTYSFDSFIDLVYRGVGNVSEEANATLWRTPKEGFVSLHPNPKQNVLVHTGNALLHKQLLQPERFNRLVQKVSFFIQERAHWDCFFSSSVLASSADMKIVSLHRWCLDVTMDAQTRSFFGTHLHEIEPEYATVFDQWDINSWMVTYQYPAFLAKAATLPRERLVRALRQYLDAPREKREGTVPFVTELEEEMRHAGINSEDAARVFTIILWGINSNVQMTLFWMISYILDSSSLTAKIREEITPAMKALESLEQIDPVNLADTIKEYLISGCPVLHSTFAEVLRICTTGNSVREVTKPTELGGKKLDAGTRVFLPMRQLLSDPQAFGHRADEFDCDRFARDKSLERHDYYRPFGGGVTLCSGKMIGRYEVCTFIAFIFWRFDIQVLRKGESVLSVDGMHFPRLDVGKPSNGVSKQVEGDDMILKVTKKRV